MRDDNALLAQFLLDWGASGGELSGKATDAVTDILIETMETWLQSIHKKTRVLPNLGLSITDDPKKAGAEYYAQPGKLFISVATMEEDGAFLNIRESIEHLERLLPGFGRLVLFEIERASYDTMQIFMPALARGHAEYLWWHCNSTEEEFREMVATEYEGEEPDVPSPAKFDACFPDWVVEGFRSGRKERHHAGIDATLEAANELEDDLARSMAHAMRRLIDSKGQMPDLRDTDMDLIFWGSVLWWGDAENGPERIIDDINQYRWEGGQATEVIGIWSVEPGKVSVWKAAAEAAFEKYAALDDVLAILMDSEQKGLQKCSTS